MIHSMTGFAVQTRDLGPVSLHLELRSVNSRYLDLNFRIVEDLRQAEPAIREQITGRLSRGKVECRLNLQTNNAAPRTLALNSGLLAQLADAQTKVQAQFPSAKPMSVGELLRGRQAVALHAQRIDVAEALTRLTTHLDELERILKAGGAAGKRLDFLMQELNREANTLASKSPATDITAVAMEMKVLIEQIREQVQNLE